MCNQLTWMNISSLKYKNFSDRPGIRCKFASIAGLLKVGKWDLFLKISSCVISVSLGWSRLIQWGIYKDNVIFSFTSISIAFSDLHEVCLALAEFWWENWSYERDETMKCDKQSPQGLRFVSCISNQWISDNLVTPFT